MVVGNTMADSAARPLSARNVDYCRRVSFVIAAFVGSVLRGQSAAHVEQPVQLVATLTSEPVAIADGEVLAFFQDPTGGVSLIGAHLAGHPHDAPGTRAVRSPGAAVVHRVPVLCDILQLSRRACEA
jgi:hypothetical protein